MSEKNQMYVTGVVIPNGLKHYSGDVLNKSEIKQIFTKYVNRDTDTMHSRIRNKGVNVLANWISETPTKIKDKVAPAGSWLVTLQIENEDIIENIRNGQIGGISLGSVKEDAMDSNFWFINKSIRYKDLDDIDEAVPLFISLVDKPDNMFGLEIADYNVYINKRMEEDTMTEKKEDIGLEDEKISIGGLSKIREMFSINKSVDAEEPPQEVKVEPKKEESDIDSKFEELGDKIDKIPEAVAEGMVKGFEKLGLTAGAKPKEEDEEEEEEEETSKQKEGETKKETKKEEDVEINKRATIKEDAEIDIPNTSTNFYKMSGRDPATGCRIRK